MEEQYLKAILATVARQTFPAARITEIVTAGGGGERQLRAYNLCDGSHSQTEITKTTGIDPASLSRSISRWIDEGILFRMGDGRESRPLHLYPLPSSAVKKANKKGKSNAE